MHSKQVWSLNHDITTSLGLGLSSIFLKSTPDLPRHNSVRVDSCAHPQHIMVLKHFVYIWQGCGMHSKQVWSLNHEITTSLRRCPTPIFLNSTPDLHRYNSGRAYAHSWHIKLLKHFVYIWHGCGMHSKQVWSLNHDITTSLRLRHTPIFLNSTPDLHRRNSVRVDPFAHPQHISRGSGPEFSSSFFFLVGGQIFRSSRKNKKQTDREQHKALFLTTW